MYFIGGKLVLGITKLMYWWLSGTNVTILGSRFQFVNIFCTFFFLFFGKGIGRNGIQADDRLSGE